MKIELFLLFLILTLSISFVSGEEDKRESFILTDCIDGDGDSPFTPNSYKWNYTGANGGGGSGSSADSCSFHYWYVLRYFGEEIKFGDSILVEGVCPIINLSQEKRGGIQQQLQKFYKCECESTGSGGEKGTENFVGYCKNTPEEIPAKLVYEAEEKWFQDGRPNPPFIIRLLKLLGWGG